MKLLYYFIMLYFISCGAKHNLINNKNNILLNMDSTLVMGENNNYKNKFILVEPRTTNIIADKYGNIILSDELFIKIYNKTGMGLKVLGGKGEGPGRYLETPNIFISPTGFLTAVHTDLSRRFVTYDSNYQFVNDLRLDNLKSMQKFNSDNNYEIKNIKFFDKFYALSEKEYIYSVEIYSNGVFYYTIIHDIEDSLYVVFNDKHPGHIIVMGDGGGWSKSGNYGKINWGLLNNNKLYYFNSSEDAVNNNKQYEFSLHIISLESYTERVFKHEFDPVSYPPDIVKRMRENASTSFVETHKKLYSKIEQVYAERKYWPLRGSITDGKYIYFYPYMQYNSTMTRDDNLPEQNVILFDAERMEFLHNFKLNYVYYSIYNGNIYYADEDEDGLPEIRVYKINDEIFRNK